MYTVLLMQGFLLVMLPAMTRESHPQSTGLEIKLIHLQRCWQADLLHSDKAYLQNLSVFIAHLRSSLSSAFFPVIGAE